MPKKILLVEDEKHIARFVELELQHEGYDVTVAFEGREGLSLATTDAFDVLLLDVMLPGINGIEICRRIRTQSQVPIILITARDAVMDRVAGLDAGADDYIVKPFAIEELLARIRTIIRRATTQEPANSECLSLRDIEIDIAAYEVFVQGNKLDLTKTEYDLLKLLIEHKNRVCTREHILTSVWGYDTDIETNVVDVYIRHLRSKLPGDTNAYIETVRGVGYVMRE
ncbi:MULTISPECIES: response regulator transcription factor [Lysinibacillus]|uniref:response regulator transcription factor n=1 Tax=Lysinibacillus TaxID=400634 RepID=UPI00056BDF6F|nr:response regulator transcription factor [Lysinibacillus sphaericus]MBI6863720.1 response regulator transcription factor [Lysinibacillus fusiformis]MBG9691238.1 PhoB family transcriptional regulator [Lysinibacillus sphaericus]MBG9755025.1 PhoB family transcriptional regulator [Lysinibacillus sphaericus]MEB7454691.1 response regulator transcription factor [Lysinibacillus sphaericus]QTB15621.1 response regulator transcription factor [Lysinibacillus sphaericus]